jgi:hypothetical protein
MHHPRQRLLPVAVLLGLLVLSSDTRAFSLGPAGIKAGPAFSWMNIERSDYGRSAWHDGLVVGPFLSLELSPGWSLQPNLLYVRRGGTYRDRPDDLWGGLVEVQRVTFRLDYLEVPLLLRHDFLPGKPLNSVLLFGPALGKLLSMEYVQDDYSDASWLRDWDAAFMLGVGLETKRRAVVYSLEVLYRHPLSGLDHGVKSEGISLLMGLGF